MEDISSFDGCSMTEKIRPFGVLFKALILFVVINTLYGLIQPPIADISIYNVLFPGLKRVPFGTGREPFSVTINNVDAMFAAHEISAEKLSDEVLVALIGDSSIWGEGLTVDVTL